jgi:predicted nucleic acid-binding protein
LIVADTNAVVYLFVRGEHTQAAEAAAQKDPVWIAPALWKSEMKSALTVYLRKGSLSLPDAIQALSRAAAFVGAPDQDPSPIRVFEMALASGCSAYDCEFAALAHDLGVPLLTSDAKLLEKFPKLAVSLEKFAQYVPRRPATEPT